MREELIYHRMQSVTSQDTTLSDEGKKKRTFSENSTASQNRQVNEPFVEEMKRH